MNPHLAGSPPVLTTRGRSAAASAVPQPNTAAKASILLVDDRPDKLLAIEAVLDALGQNIVKANSGKQALRCLLKQDFAVVILDVSMPGMDGFETAALIRTRERCERTPIIFVTSFGATDNHISRGYSLGAVDYLITPVVPEILCAKVSVFVDLFKQTEIIRQQAEQLRLLELQKHQRELAVVSNRLEAETKRNRFFTMGIDLLAIATLDGRFLQVNPSWNLILGYSEEELCERSLHDFVVPEDMGALTRLVAELREDPTPKTCETRFLHRSGAEHWLSLTMAAFPAEDLLYLFAKDVTARKTSEGEIRRLNGELQQKVAALTAANAELEAFNYSIAHDLRAPLRSMSSFATALLEDEAPRLSEQGMDFARRIVRSAKYMDALLGDLLDYGKLARTQFTHELIDLEAAVHETLAMFSTEISSRSATVDIAAPLGTAKADLATVRQILTNLIDNALKFVPADRHPSIRFSTTTQSDGLIRLWVEDNGIGIPEQHRNRVFGLFCRLHTADTYPGTGIGLAIVRKGAERLGGNAGVDSRPGEGSRFWIDLPAGPDQHAAAPASNGAVTSGLQSACER